MVIHNRNVLFFDRRWMSGCAVLALANIFMAAPAQAQSSVPVVNACSGLRLPRSAVSVARGQSARIKQVEIAGRELADLVAAWGPPPDR